MDNYKPLVITPTLKNFCEQVAKFPEGSRVRLSLDMLRRMEEEQKESASGMDNTVGNGTFIVDPEPEAPEENIIFRNFK